MSHLALSGGGAGNSNPALTPPRLIMSNSPSLQKKTESVFSNLHYPDHVTHRIKHEVTDGGLACLKKVELQENDNRVSLRDGWTPSHQQMIKAQERKEDDDPAEWR